TAAASAKTRAAAVPSPHNATAIDDAATVAATPTAAAFISTPHHSARGPDRGADDARGADCQKGPEREAAGFALLGRRGRPRRTGARCRQLEPPRPRHHMPVTRGHPVVDPVAA